MKTNFIICGDLHYRGANPRARLDDYKTALNKKLHEVFSIAARYNAKAIICPGDIFDSPSVALGTIAELGLNIALTLKAKILGNSLQESPCPILTVPGNHDLWGHNPASKPRTPYGFLAMLGYVWDLTEEPFEAGINPYADIIITGHGFNVETDTPLGKEQFDPATQFVQLEDSNDFRIHVVHANLMDHSPSFDMRHTLISQVETTANVIVSGHLHTGFGNSYIYRRDDGVLFINPGALCRLSAHHAEMERTVQVALITVHEGKENGWECEAELIPLKSAAPGHEVLSRAHLEAEAEREERLEKFLNLLTSEGESKFLEVRDILEDIAAREELPQEVQREALRRVAVAREALEAGVQG